MDALKHICANAADNVNSQICRDHRFPRNVFGSAWCEFFFFDSDWMFDAAFVGHVKALLEIEGATCACLANMDASVDDDLRKSRFFIDRTTTPDSYQLLLRGTNPGVGWIYDIDRFGCSSEASEWCMYCERSSEIAIIAFRCDVSLERYVPVIKSFKAVHIAEALKQQLAYGFSSQALAAAWRSELLAEYASRSQSLSGA